MRNRRLLWLCATLGLMGCLTGRAGLQHAPTPTQRPATQRETLSGNADAGTPSGKPRPTAKDLSQPKAR